LCPYLRTWFRCTIRSAWNYRARHILPNSGRRPSRSSVQKGTARMGRQKRRDYTYHRRHLHQPRKPRLRPPCTSQARAKLRSRSNAPARRGLCWRTRDHESCCPDRKRCYSEGPARILAFACELCSPNVRCELAAAEKSTSRDVGIGGAIFSDGAAAFVLCNSLGLGEATKPVFELLEWGTGTLPGTEHHMSFVADPFGERASRCTAKPSY
jgi:hypothetical protein